MKKKSLRAESFIATRNHHLSETAEDYVEMIHDLICLKGEARVSDIADCLGVSHVTVVKTIGRLKKKGYLQGEPHRPITLTEEGTRLAAFSKQRHSFLLEYLILLGVPKETAQIDVEGMEHHVSPVTFEALQKHFEYLKNQ
jgi:DtxR family manganese transport transcriptional regulator